jgi:hypothetical protein
MKALLFAYFGPATLGEAVGMLAGTENVKLIAAANR